MKNLLILSLCIAIYLCFFLNSYIHTQSNSIGFLNSFTAYAITTDEDEYEDDEYEDDEDEYEDEEEDEKPATIKVTVSSTGEVKPNVPSSNDEDEECDEDDEDCEYEEEETEEDEVEKKILTIVSNGYLRHPGGSHIKINSPLLNEDNLPIFSSNYDCKTESAIVVNPEKLQELESNYETTKNTAELIHSKLKDLESKFQRTKFNHDSDSTKKNEEFENEENNENNELKEKEVEQEVVPVNKKKLKNLYKENFIQQKNLAKSEKEKKLTSKIYYYYGSSCEYLSCTSCQVLLEDFTNTLISHLKNPKVRYVEDIFNVENFCNKKFIHMKYNDLVYDQCNELFYSSKMSFYRDFIITNYEKIDSWDDLKDSSIMNQLKEKICLDIGACSKNDIRLYLNPRVESEEQWDETCFTCRAMAKNLEARSSLLRMPTDALVKQLVSNTCNVMNFPPKYDEICKDLVKRKHTEFSYLTKVHEESIKKNARGEIQFPTKVCLELKLCQHYIDPEVLKEKEINESVEEVFY